MTFRLAGKQRHARNNQDLFLWWAHHKCIGSSLFSREKPAVWISLFWLLCFQLKTCRGETPHCWNELRLSHLSGAGILLEEPGRNSSFSKFGFPGLNLTIPFILSMLSPVSHPCIAWFCVFCFVLFSNFCPWESLSLIWHTCTRPALLLWFFYKCSTLWHQHRFWFNKKSVMGVSASVSELITFTLQGLLSYGAALLGGRPTADPNTASVTNWRFHLVLSRTVPAH